MKREECILFENTVCLVFNKLCGEDSERLAAGGLFVVHRLDRPVSGCVVLAKDRSSAAFLSDLFARQDGLVSEADRIKKRYWAVVEKPGDVPHPALSALPGDGEWAELIHWIKFDAKKNKSFAGGEEGGGGKKARLRYRLSGRGDNYLFMEIELLSGRHHQIRAQLAHLGFHVKGDLKYGAKRSEREGGIRLHARSLVFPNPLNREERIRVEAPPPRMDALWEAFMRQVNE